MEECKTKFVPKYIIKHNDLEEKSSITNLTRPKR